MTAKQLAQRLRAQANGPRHMIELDDATLEIQGLDKLIAASLRRPAPLLLVVNPAAIPEEPGEHGFEVAVTVPDGSEGFLALDGCQAILRFLVGGTIDLQLTVAAGAQWVFSTSFPELEYLPYDDLDVTEPELIFSTGAASLEPVGLNFSGKLELGDLLGPIGELLKLAGSSSYRLTGQLHGAGTEFQMELEAPFDLGETPEIGKMVALEKVGAGVSFTQVKQKSGVEQLVDLYLQAKVQFENKEGETLALDLRAGVPLTGGEPGTLVLAVLPGSKFETSLDKLGKMIDGYRWDHFFEGPAEPIGELLKDFGMRSYSLVVSPTDASVISMALDVGTEEKWPMWSGGPELEIDALWLLTFLGSTPSSYVRLTALFTYKALTFELTIDSNLQITGIENGTLPELKLSELNDKVFDGHPVIPEDLLDVTVGNITFEADVNTKLFTIGAVATIDVELFGSELLGVREMSMSMTFDDSQKEPTYTGRLDGEVFLGPIAFQTDATISSAKGVDTVFTLHLVDETVGSMLGHLVHIVDPTFDISFGEPWDKLLDISLDAFVLHVNVTQGTVELSYEPPGGVKLGFLSLEKVDLSYTKAREGKPSSTKVEVAGEFFGAHFPDPAAGRALAWDPINEAPPAVPGPSTVLDLEYVGLGQHIGLVEDPQTMEQVMEKLRASAAPVQPGALPPFGSALAFKGDSSWLFGAQLTVMNTVAIQAVFNDPDLYGVVIQLSGEKAQIFAGLRFEILYRKVTETIGVYHIELKLPDAMRHLEFGEVSLTLPIVDLDVYTNGNFRIDLGFPKGLDFSRSFSVEVFPFVGFGGFYYAQLEGATSSRVPVITNGTFSPVIEFGVALSIGAGKEIDEGILSGGVTVTVVGILEGVLAWFHPTDTSPAETYYWFKGTIAVTGQLYATVEFVIIQASVEVTAHITATLVVESHEPIHVEASAGVSVRVSVKIVFFTIHLSFEATVDASFTIGSASTTPWHLAPGSSSSNGPRRLLSGQGTLHAPLAHHSPGVTRALRRARLAAQPTPPLTDWPAVCVTPQGTIQTLTIHALPGFAKAESRAIAGTQRASNTSTITTVTAHDLDAGDPVTLAGVSDASFDGTFTVASVASPTSFTFAQPGADAQASGGLMTAAPVAGSGETVMLFSAQTSIPHAARTLAEHRELAGENPNETPFNLLMQTMLGWGMYVETHRTVATAVRSAGIATLETTAPHDFAAGAGVTVEKVGEGFDGVFTIVAVPTATAFTYAQNAPDAKAGAGGTVFANSVTAARLEDLRQQLSRPETIAAAFAPKTLTEFLAANFVFDVQPAEVNTEASVALFPVFPQLTLQDTAGTRIEFSTHNQVDEAYAEKIRAYFRLLQTQFQAQSEGAGARADASTLSIATILFTQYFAMLMSNAAKAATDLLASYPYTVGQHAQSLAEIAVAVADHGLESEPLRLVAPNQDAKVLAQGASIELPDVVRQVQAGETLTGIAASLAGQGARGASGPYAAADLLNANAEAPIFQAGAPLPLGGLPYTTTAGDTFALIATRVLVRAGGATVLGYVSELGAQVEALVHSSGIADPNESLKAGTVVKLPDGGTYTTVLDDTLTLIAAYLTAPAQGIVSSESYAKELQKQNPDVKEPLVAGQTLTLAALSRPLAPGETIASLARSTMSTEAAIGNALLGLGSSALSAHAALHAPLTYEVGGEDTLGAIAAKFDLTLAYLAGQAAGSAGLFAANASLTIADLESIAPGTLLEGLLGSGEWNNAAGMVSRFLLCGLRLPDPNDPDFQRLTPRQLLEPGNLAGIRTKPMFELSGQQYPLGTAVPQGYEVTLEDTTGSSWLTLGGSGSHRLTFPFSEAQTQLFDEIAGTSLIDDVSTLTPLALYRMAPPRLALQTHIAWQAAQPLSGCTPAEAATGNPSVWMFPDALVTELAQIANGEAAPAYELVSARTPNAGEATVTAEVGAYAWATLVNFTISLPSSDGPTESLSNTYVVEGADDTGASLLAQLQSRVQGGDSVELFLLYPPDPTSANASGLVGDVLDPQRTFLLKANLSTLTHAATVGASLESEAPAVDPTEVYAAALGDPADFLAVLWEASITRSGGFYLSYTDADGGASLPGTVFSGSSTAQLSLVALLRSQTGRLTIAGAVRTGGTTTIRTTTVHGLAAGDTVSVQGVRDTTFDADGLKVLATPTPWSFTYAQTGQPDATSGGGAASAGGAVLPSGGLLAFNNCAVVGENVDPTVTSLFVQPATYTVQPEDTLATIAKGLSERWGATLDPGELATLNATVPLLLTVGARLAVPGLQAGYEVRYGDTFATVVEALEKQGIKTTAAELGQANAGSSQALAVGAFLQLSPGVLRPTRTVPPGMVGFEMTRANPQGKVALDSSSPVQELFNLAGWSIAASEAFTASGAGLPTTPSDRFLLEADGRTRLPADAGEDTHWYYQQTLAAAPFGKPAHGSSCPALPPPAANPYNGIELTQGRLGQLTIALTLQDVYGNAQPLPHDGGSLNVPVGYFDELCPPSGWPSLTLSYLIEGPPAKLSLTLEAHQSRYIPSASVTVPAALAAIAADLRSYTGIYYQLVQPDVEFAVETTLALGTDGQLTRQPLQRSVFLSFASAMYVYLAALSTTTPVKIAVQAPGEQSVAKIVENYGTASSQLFAANQTQLYSSLFGSGLIAVPAVYTTTAADSLDSVIATHASFGLTSAKLAALNQDVALDPGAELRASTRSVVVQPPPEKPSGTAATLAEVAGAAHESAGSLAAANAKTPGLLQVGVALTYGIASYVVEGGDELERVAEKLHATVEQVAQANAQIPVLVPGRSLSVTGVAAHAGDTLRSLAAIPGVGEVASLAAANSGLANLFAPASQLLLGVNGKPTAPLPSDTLASFAAANRVTVEQLALANDGHEGAANAQLAAGATVELPATLVQQPGSQQFCTYRAAEQSTIAQIATLFGTTVARIEELNPEPPSAGGQWICPQMRGDAHGANAERSLAGLARAYNTELEALAVANAANLGLLAEDVELTVGGASYKTRATDTLNSLVNRFAALGVSLTLDALVQAVEAVKGLIASDSGILPVPPPPVGVSVALAPRFSEAVFPIAVNVLEQRDPALVAPDFAGVGAVSAATVAAAPEPAPGANAEALSLTYFTEQLEAALPGLHVATGPVPGEGDPASASTLWGVNFDAAALGPTLEYEFKAPATAYFALPPLSSSLMAGEVPIVPYVSGQDPPFTDAATTQSLQGVELDGWLREFLAAVDVFLSPAYAVPAYALAPSSTIAVLEAKRALAQRLANRVQPLLEEESGSAALAAEALRDSLLTELASAYTIDTLVQVPLRVVSYSSDPRVAPRLAGQLVETAGSGEASCSFSTAKVALTDGGSAATFLLSVKAPADHRSVGVDLEYVVAQLELPDPAETIGEYEGSSWLKFVRPVSGAGSAIPGLDIPIPLRVYPPPVTLAAQSAVQSVTAPADAEDLLPWDFAFVYQHEDAEQDTPLVEVAFNTGLERTLPEPPNQQLQRVFAALAQFNAAWPALKDDLALMTAMPPGDTLPTAKAAVDAFAWLAERVAGAFAPTLSEEAGPYTPPPSTRWYRLQKEQTEDAGPQATLTELVVSAVDAENRVIASGENELWPASIVAIYQNVEHTLQPVGKPTSERATFAYPPGVIPADAQFAQRFLFQWPGGPEGSGSWPTPPPGLPAQTFLFHGVNVLGQQSGRAGISIWRNLELVDEAKTNPAFVYRTPVSGFTASAVPSIVAGEPIPIGGPPTSVAQALGTFMHTLLTSHNQWAGGETLEVRLAGGYSYPLASAGAEQLGPTVPVFLVADTQVEPLADLDPTDPRSFVSQIGAVVEQWQTTRKPRTEQATIVFDLTIYASGGQLQPLIHATRLSYSAAQRDRDAALIAG